MESSRGQWRDLGARAHVFDGRPYTLYLPPKTRFRVSTETGCDLALCYAKAEEEHEGRLVKPEEGHVRFQEREVTRLPMHQRARLGIGYLTQEPSVFRKLTVEQNILAILETCAIDKLERQVRLKYLLDELDLARLAKSKAYLLSGGEKRRLEITRALVTSPKLMLLDEPFSGIDPIAVYEVQKIVRRLKERGLGILITDHNVRETLKLVDRAYLIHKGEVVYEGAAEQLVNDPKAREIYLGPEFNL